ncbi:TetR/AcrR family transcriptional regulator [Protaetiibacter intestinalis]|uniref:TetR/AcrR family transcriptional regulator n=1 Tax=Protaetiibacter intestinalis TaxID=2419774 RepID=A0A387BFT5_9MICO|nr:TetR/AcrR family transcriptional regulator [Protaetiibacter intestinalis]AYF97370.1 TetR/AcrR family transcriptional regulator [Protaetiibacter intestinalis]
MSGAPPATELSATEEKILGAYSELIEEVGTDDVSFRLIALRAGVGERTVFRYYPTRVDLLLATAAWIERTIFTRQESDSVFDVPLAIREAMEGYDRRPELAYVVAETAMRGVNGAEPAPHRERFDELLRSEVPTLGAGERTRIVAALCHLDSSATWVTMRRELGMSGRDIADAAHWAAEAILDPIRHRVG